MSADTPPSSVAQPHVNRLSRETSPYLLQHQHNPVDWYAWGPEAFEAARRENKPIFLSVGYSTCYWCHVMERESFENEAIAAEMNQRFISIKVDREERPDVDQLYMTFVQITTHHGGWPMSVFLTPDLKPFYGGTYFPPAHTGGRAGFVKVLHAVEDAYRNRRAEVDNVTRHYVQVLQRLAEPPPATQPIAIDEAFIDRLVRRSVSDYDSRHGGFGSSPKFPRQTLLEMLQVYNRGKSSGDLSRMLRHTLDAMESGGIRDHLGGGFHRYSTDAQWLVPHFEIMLYDNAMLAWIYVEAFVRTEEVRYAHVARGIMDFILREMTSPDGAFFTAFDAEVDAQEGLSYLWTADEFNSILGPDAELVGELYGLSRGPNFSDPHHGSGAPDKNILYLPEPLERVAERFRMPPDEIYDRLAAAREKLYAARLKRKQPLLDTKIITSWNALMIRALACGGAALQEHRYIDAAARAAEFLLLHHRTSDGGLYRASRPMASGVVGQAAQSRNAAEEFRQQMGAGADQEAREVLDAPATHAGAPELAAAAAEGAKINGFLDDYAFFIQALLALHDAGADERFHDAAHALGAVMRDKFGDPDGGFYFTQAPSSDASPDELIIRQKIGSDSPLPSGNAVAAMTSLELGDAETARKTLAVFAESLDRGGEGMSAMIEAAILYVRQHHRIEVSGSASAATPGGPADSSAPESRAVDKSQTPSASAMETERPESPAELAEKIVDVQAEWISPTELRLYLNILRNFHINAHSQQAAEQAEMRQAEGNAATALAATELSIGGPAAASVAGIDYPPGENHLVGSSKMPLHVYENTVTLVVRFTEPGNAQAAIPISLTYQACDESACLPTITRHLEVPTA